MPLPFEVVSRTRLVSVFGQSHLGFGDGSACAVLHDSGDRSLVGLTKRDRSEQQQDAQSQG